MSVDILLFKNCPLKFDERKKKSEKKKRIKLVTELVYIATYIKDIAVEIIY